MSKGRFGVHGGQYIPETLMNAVIELEEAYARWKDDPGFVSELEGLLKDYAGRPSLLYYAEKMTKDLGARRSTSSGRTSTTPAPTSSTTSSGRCCSPSGWARPA